MKRDELLEFIKKNIPFAIRATRKSKTTYISPFTSYNAQKVICEALAENIYNEYFSTLPKEQEMSEEEIERQLLDRFGFIEDGVDVENQLKIFSFMKWYRNHVSQHKGKCYPEEFVRWLNFGCHDFYLNAEKDQTEYYQEGSHTIYTLEEVYEHWQTNNKDK